MNTISPIAASHVALDSRIAFLACASARLLLFEVGEIDITEAFDGLIEPFRTLFPCQCERELVDRWERNYRPRRGRR
jgi:hypothetical protein